MFGSMLCFEDVGNVFFCLYLAQHHLFCFQLFGHRDDGRPHQATLPRHDGGESDPAVQSIR